MNFITLFPEIENIHLPKDVGMIPYVLYKHYNYNSTIVCYKNSRDYFYLNKELKGLGIDFLKKQFNNPTLDGIVYLFKNSKNIDILNLYHFRIRSIIWSIIYKLLNKKGKIYLKLDIGFNNLGNKKNKFKVLIKRLVLKKNIFDIVSIENKSLIKSFSKLYSYKPQYIPNGFYNFDKGNINKENIDKENIIITVGRIGSYQKASDILLEAFATSSIKHNWNLKLIGPIDYKFRKFIDKYFIDNPNLKNRVIFTELIEDRIKLQEEYLKSKVFILPSRWEGFPLVLPDALRNSCYCILSNQVPSALEITDKQKYGVIVPVDNVKAFSDAIVKVCNSDIFNDKLYKDIENHAYKNFYWLDICKKIDILIKNQVSKYS